MAADMAAVDEELRHGPHAGRAADHLAAFLLIEGDVDLLEGESLVGEEALGGAAVTAEGRGVERCAS